MEIEEALMAYLLTKPTLTALIGTRIMPDDISGGAALPALTYQKISDVKIHTHQGQSKTEQPMIQFTSYAMARPNARAISNQVKSALCDFKGTLSGLTVQHVKLENEISGSETMADGTGKVYTEDLEYQVSFNKE